MKHNESVVKIRMLTSPSKLQTVKGEGNRTLCAIKTPMKKGLNQCESTVSTSFLNDSHNAQSEFNAKWIIYVNIYY